MSRRAEIDRDRDAAANWAERLLLFTELTKLHQSLERVGPLGEGDAAVRDILKKAIQRHFDRCRSLDPDPLRVPEADCQSSTISRSIFWKLGSSRIFSNWSVVSEWAWRI